MAETTAWYVLNEGNFLTADNAIGLQEHFMGVRVTYIPSCQGAQSSCLASC